MRFLSLCCLCSLLLLPACDGQTRERRTARGEDFVSDPDHLYFRNVRSRDYRAVTLSEGLEAYYHDDLEGEPSLIIRDNWLDDRAELLLGDRPLSLPEVRELYDRLRSGSAESPYSDDRQRRAATEVVEDYLRLIGG
ncbi:hypothetical protein [Neolewinella litorea]|uniref:Uncharacterized protein n=1 Tax=Neolewinella litorea TaxID=2562452 RepID=A0A4S4NU92_9BACT|nr:hypothetical protein [Neolewinella litorea]THH39810.1 hypothetical protein E4021_09360 [Neolewinella litorea]